MSTAGLVFPHQLFRHNEWVAACDVIFLVEEHLFFKQFPFHKQKIRFHRASMKFYESHLLNRGLTVEYIEASDELADVRQLLPHLKERGVQAVHCFDPTDEWLRHRIQRSCQAMGTALHMHASPMFINTAEEVIAFFEGKKRMFQTEFYKHQRQRLGVLIEHDGSPIGGKWSFDDENRLKYPKDKMPPSIAFPAVSAAYEDAATYTLKHFSDNPGSLHPHFVYPTTFEESDQWLNDFFQHRFAAFGAYEDALVASSHLLHHSMLTPMLNVGLLTPDEVLDKALKFAAENEVPINSLEGFVRQIIGWREFIRAVYDLKGTAERTKNFWKFKRKVPASFWNGTTGIWPVDNTIRKVLDTGYCHHIERLMVLGNFMLLCEFDPDEVYRWFMALFIDAYDWVMVPNVYGMSQFADGGLMATKPYISGSNYLMKMSDYPKGEWQVIWDGLFWRFMHTHRDFFMQNPRLGMLVGSFDRMEPSKQLAHLRIADAFLAGLD